MKVCSPFFLALFFLLLTASFLLSDPIEKSVIPSHVHVQLAKCPINRDYYLYLPEKIDPDRTYWLVCYAHGLKDPPRADFSTLLHFVMRGDCIAVFPAFKHGF